MAKSKKKDDETNTGSGDSLNAVSGASGIIEPQKEREFNPSRSISEEADEQMNQSAIAQKIHTGIIYRDRETTMKVKIVALNKTREILAAENIGKAEIAYWKKVQQDIAVR